jgi:hypothetical protein
MVSQGFPDRRTHPGPLPPWPTTGEVLEEITSMLENAGHSRASAQQLAAQIVKKWAKSDD